MHFAGHVRQSEIRSSQRGETLALVGAQAKVPSGRRFLVSHRLIHELRKSQQVEERRARTLAHELACARFRDREAELVAANTLRLQFEARGARQVRGRDPKLAAVGAGRSNFRCDVVIHNRGANFLGRRGSGRQRRQEKKCERTDGKPDCFHREFPFEGGVYTKAGCELLST